MSRNYHSDTENKPCPCSGGYRVGRGPDILLELECRPADKTASFSSAFSELKETLWSEWLLSATFIQELLPLLKIQYLSVYPSKGLACNRKTEWSTGPSYNKSEPLIRRSARSQSQKTMLQNSIYLKACEYSKRHWTVHFKRVKFMVCKLYLSNKAVKKIPD